MMNGLPLWLIVAMAACYGLILGSFTTCVLYRVPRGISIWRHQGQDSYRSFCPTCKTPLTARDLIPVLSWVMQKGKCRHCGAPIGISYMLVELAIAAASVVLVLWLWHGLGFGLLWFFAASFIPVLAAIWGVLRAKKRF